MNLFNNILFRLKTKSIYKLNHPPKIGETYEVICADSYPILGRPHSDPLLGSEATKFHYHLDYRFMSDEEMRKVNYEPNCVYQVGFRVTIPTIEFYVKPKIVKQSRVCYRKIPGYAHITKMANGGTISWYSGETIDHFGRFEDSMEKKKFGGICKVCPHQKIPLSSIKPINGIITCPGHQLDWCASTGKMIRRTVKQKDGSYSHAVGPVAPSIELDE